MNKDLLNIIIENNHIRESHLSEYACKSKDGIRLNPNLEKVPDSENIRPIFFHDTDKIIHSRSYTRYMDKTQVFSLFENDHITHRSLHVQFVAKIGRTIGRCLNLNEDLIEAISLGHDLGHTPFGHDGETYLNDLCLQNDAGYFVHNAQSVRSLMELENHGEGLNISLQVLDGFLAHNGEILSEKYEPQRNKTPQQFLEEYHKCFTEKNYSINITPMTLEGCVMRICDIIAYIGRDFEDAIRVKLLKRDELPNEISSVLGNSNDVIINTLVNDLITKSFNKPFLAFSDDVFSALNSLKNFNYKQIYLNPAIKTESRKIKNMFVQLFEIYLNDIKTNNEKSDIFKFFIKSRPDKYIEITSPARMVADYLAGMTDDFLVNQYNKEFVPQSFGYYLNENNQLKS